MERNVLVTGGAGYIGTHTVVELLNEGFDVVVIDNLSNSNEESLKRIEKITGKKVKFYKVDLRNEKELEKVFKENTFASVIHFAGLKAVGVSVEKPLVYYDNNVVGSIMLFRLMGKYKVEKLVFSSSACVYGEPKEVPIKEDSPLQPLNPYGQTKFIVEQIIKDIAVSDKEFKAAILRYFNPVGAHKSGLIGEDPQGIPDNLSPFIAQVAVGKLKKLKIFGNDYNTKDGTAVRDYIHITDLATGHLKALEKLDRIDSGVVTYNLGTGKGCTVLDVVKAFEKAVGKKIPYEFVGRRSGDAESVYADPSLANKELNWFAKKDINEMCKDVWNWQSKNTNGYC